MLGRVLRPASAVRPTGDAAFLVFRIGRHRQSSWASRPIIVLALLLFCVFDPQIAHEPVEALLVAVVLFPASKFDCSVRFNGSRMSALKDGELESSPSLQAW